MPGDGYEYTSPITIASTKTPDQVTPGLQPLLLRSPFGQEACEFAIQLINFEGAGTLVISAEGVASTPVYAATNDGGFRGYEMKVGAAVPLAFTPVFTPLRNGALYFSINMTSGLCAVAVLFRRKIAEHVAQFSPMYHSANPDDMDAVQAAHSQAMERGTGFPTTASDRKA